MNKHKIYCILLLSVIMGSCKTYHITTASLLEQLADTKKVKSEFPIPVVPNVNMYLALNVEGTNLRTINVLDKKGNTKILPVTKRTGIRITQKNGKRTTFYFNTLLIEDSSITGAKTHFLNVRTKPIHLSNIAKIELQE